MAAAQTELKAGRDASWKTISGCCQHFAEWCGEEEEACTSYFLKGLSSTQLLSGRTQASGAQRMRLRPVITLHLCIPTEKQLLQTVPSLPAGNLAFFKFSFLAADGPATISPNLLDKD